LTAANTLSAIQGRQNEETRYLPLVLKPVIPALLCVVMVLAGMGLEVSAKALICRSANSISITRSLFTFQKRIKAGGHLRTPPLRSSTISIHIPQCSSLWYVFYHCEATLKAFWVGGSARCARIGSPPSDRRHHLHDRGAFCASKKLQNMFWSITRLQYVRSINIILRYLLRYGPPWTSKGSLCNNLGIS
jgi:hypothetical protein